MRYLTLIILFASFGINAMAFQNANKSYPPKSDYEGYRILITGITIMESSKDELLLKMNVINSGRKEVKLGTFSEIPKSLQTKFEESFYRSNLVSKEEEIKNQLFGKDLELPIGKIMRNINLSLSSDEDLYKKLGKKKQKYARHYQPKVDKTKPNLSYKTSNTKESALPSIRLKKKQSTAVVTEVKEKEESKKKVKDKERMVKESKAEEKKVKEPKVKESKPPKESKPKESKPKEKIAKVKKSKEKTTKKEADTIADAGSQVDGSTATG